MIDKENLIKALYEECRKDIYKEIPSWILKVIENQPDSIDKCEKLEKVSDKASEELVTMINAVNCWDYESCPFRSMCKEGTNYCHDKEKWEEYLLDETN